MKLSSIFGNNDKKKRLSHIRNVIGVASIDGYMDEAELAAINGIAAKIGITKSEIDLVLNNPNSIEFHPPTSEREKIIQLHDLVLVMIIDGEIDDDEYRFCQICAKNLGFHPDIINEVIETTIQMVEKGVDADMAISELASIIK